ncbi:MAG TPA: methyltransferase domain-containing protein [Xanthobacteraceae bacterium]|jgi:hypothetical protein|nr:methyltransferase domain-containing protein [Xanthobacteraceae bacterium]
MRHRQVEPEWLDALPARDPRALRSRRDLDRLNALMFQAPILARALRREGIVPPRTMLDLGGGDGMFALRLARRLAPSWPGVRLILVDRKDTVAGRTRAAFAALGWTLETVVADILSFLEQRAYALDLAVANLVLHHFVPEELERLLRYVARATRAFAACEPRRGVLALQASRLVGLVGCAAVTRNDAVTSVRAGFAGRELTAAWPQTGWRVSEYASGPFTHCFVASRNSGRAR